MPNRSDELWVVSQAAQISWNGGKIEIMSAISGATLQAHHLGILYVIHAFATARSIEEAVSHLGNYSNQQVAACIRELIDARILIKASEREPAMAHQWERTALAFHLKSRRPVHRASRPRNSVAVVPPRSGRTIALEHPAQGKGRDFFDILESRRSLRAWPNRMIKRNVLSEFFWMSARNRQLGLDESDHDYVSRPYPSGGALYSLELYPVIASEAVESVSAGVYRYLPASHGLEVLSEEPATYLPLLEAAGRSAACDLPPIVLVICSRFARQSEVYGDLAYSLVLKEVGAVFQTFYLVAEYLDLAACALGAGISNDLFARICGNEELTEPVVGEFMIGPR